MLQVVAPLATGANRLFLREQLYLVMAKSTMLFDTVTLCQGSIVLFTITEYKCSLDEARMLTLWQLQSSTAPLQSDHFIPLFSIK